MRVHDVVRGGLLRGLLQRGDRQDVVLRLLPLGAGGLLPQGAPQAAARPPHTGSAQDCPSCPPQMCCCKCKDLWEDHCKACYCVRCDKLGKRSLMEKSVNCLFSIIFPTCLMKLACICCAYCDCTTGFECYCPSTYFGFGLLCPNLPGCCSIVRMTPESRKCRP